MLRLISIWIFIFSKKVHVCGILLRNDFISQKIIPNENNHWNSVTWKSSKSCGFIILRLSHASERNIIWETPTCTFYQEMVVPDLCSFILSYKLFNYLAKCFIIDETHVKLIELDVFSILDSIVVTFSFLAILINYLPTGSIISYFTLKIRLIVMKLSSHKS